MEVYKKYLAGDLAGARAAQDKANDLVWLMKSGADMSIFKNILHHARHSRRHMRRPLLDLSEEDVADCAKAVAKYI